MLRVVVLLEGETFSHWQLSGRGFCALSIFPRTLSNDPVPVAEKHLNNMMVYCRSGVLWI